MKFLFSGISSLDENFLRDNLLNHCASVDSKVVRLTNKYLILEKKKILKNAARIFNYMLSGAKTRFIVRQSTIEKQLFLC